MKPSFRSSHFPTRVLLIAVFFLLAAAMETAQAQVVTLSATSRSFGSEAVGSTSAAKTVRLTKHEYHYCYFAAGKLGLKGAKRWRLPIRSC